MKNFRSFVIIVFGSVLAMAQADFIPPQQHSSTPVGIVSGQTARVNVLYPSIPAPLLQVMCAITVSILDDQGSVLKTQDFQMLGGMTVSLSVNADTDLQGAHAALIHARVLTQATSAGGYCEVLRALEVVDNVTAKALVHVETVVTYPKPRASAPGQ